jgi:hypothetical protein
VVFIGLLSARYNDIRKLNILSRCPLRDREKQPCITKGIVTHSLSHDRSKVGSTQSANQCPFNIDNGSVIFSNDDKAAQRNDE